MSFFVGITCNRMNCIINGTPGTNRSCENMFVRHAASEFKHLHNKSYLKKRLKGDDLGLGFGRTPKECRREVSLALMMRKRSYRVTSFGVLLVDVWYFNLCSLNLPLKLLRLFIYRVQTAPIIWCYWTLALQRFPDVNLQCLRSTVN